MQIDHPILQFKNVSISYTPGKNAVNHVNADIKKNRITAIMGPSGCGKSTLLRAINRMHELYPDIRISGEILMDNRNILKMNPMEVRRMAGMVFQRPNPFPTMSIFDNVIAGYKLNGIRLKKKEKEEIQTETLVLAPGHSARETFAMLFEKKVPMEAKSFAVGVRAEHPQELINHSQYGDAKASLPAAAYKLTAKLPDGRGVYSFLSLIHI